MTVTTSQRILAFLAYLLPALGWIIALLVGRRSRFVMYHLKQAIALLAFLVAVGAGWAAFTWLSGWAPGLFTVGVASFSLVIAAALFGLVALIIGMSHALGARMRPLPIVGAWARRLSPR